MSLVPSPDSSPAESSPSSTPAESSKAPAAAPSGTSSPARQLGVRVAGMRASRAGRIMTGLGLVLVGFLVYQLLGTPITHERNQRLLLARFESIRPEQAHPQGCGGEEEVAAGAPDGVLTGEEAAGEEPAEGAEPEVIPAPEAPARGEPLGIVEIPSIGVEEVFVQGTRPSDLRSGPGHLRGTVMPGEVGNAAIAGSRLANGAPFRRLNELEAGDTVVVTTAKGRFRYAVTEVARVDEGDPDPVRARVEDPILTLVTSAPAFVADERVAVAAELRSDPVRACFAPVTPDSSETGMDVAPGGLAPVFGWGTLLAVALFASRRLYRTWRPAVAYLLTTPVLVALSVLVFESLAGLVPATF